MFNQHDQTARLIRQLSLRVAALERELAAVRSERRPRLGTKRRRFQAVVSAASGIAANGSGEVTIYENGDPTTWKPTAYNQWMHGGLAVAYDTEIVVEWFDDRNRFDIDGAGCAAGGSHTPLP